MPEGDSVPGKKRRKTDRTGHLPCPWDTCQTEPRERGRGRSEEREERLARRATEMPSSPQPAPTWPCRTCRVREFESTPSLAKKKRTVLPAAWFAGVLRWLACCECVWWLWFVAWKQRHWAPESRLFTVCQEPGRRRGWRERYAAPSSCHGTGRLLQEPDSSEWDPLWCPSEKATSCKMYLKGYLPKRWSLVVGGTGLHHASSTAFFSTKYGLRKARLSQSSAFWPRHARCKMRGPCFCDPQLAFGPINHQVR